MNNKLIIHQDAGNNKLKQYRVYVRTRSMPVLRKLVCNHLVPSMNYKLGLLSDVIPICLRSGATCSFTKLL